MPNVSIAMLRARITWPPRVASMARPFKPKLNSVVNFRRLPRVRAMGPSISVPDASKRPATALTAKPVSSGCLDRGLLFAHRPFEFPDDIGAALMNRDVVQPHEILVCFGIRLK